MRHTVRANCRTTGSMLLDCLLASGLAKALAAKTPIAAMEDFILSRKGRQVAVQ